MRPKRASLILTTILSGRGRRPVVVVLLAVSLVLDATGVDGLPIRGAQATRLEILGARLLKRANQTRQASANQLQLPVRPTEAGHQWFTSVV